MIVVVEWYVSTTIALIAIDWFSTSCSLHEVFPALNCNKFGDPLTPFLSHCHLLKNSLLRFFGSWWNTWGGCFWRSKEWESTGESLLASLKSLKNLLTVFKDRPNDRSPKVKPKHLKCPLVAGCIMSHKPLHDSRLDMGQTKKPCWITKDGFCQFK